MTDLSDMAKEYFDLRAEKEQVEEQLKELNKRIKKLSEHDIPEKMSEQDMDKFTVSGVGTVYIKPEVYANVKKEDRDKFYEWCKLTGNGGLVQDWVFPQTLKAFVKERLENGEDYPEMVNVSVIETARLRRG